MNQPLSAAPEVRDDHPALALLRRQTVRHEPIFRGEWFQWHLKTGAHDRTPCCQSAAYHGEKTLDLCSQQPLDMVKRLCRVCGLEYSFARKNIQGWLALMFDKQAASCAASAN